MTTFKVGQGDLLLVCDPGSLVLN